MALFGAVEAGGTKFVLGVGTGPDDVVTTRVSTTTPEETIARAVAWFREQPQVAAIGIASFGPVELDESSDRFGYITSTPKAGWSDTDLAGAFRRALQVPIAFDTDVGAAAIAESLWGAARGLNSCLYLTVGTGIGGGAVLNGEILRALGHPEMGHIRVPRHPRDRFPGLCRFHGDCLEGMASGPAIEARWTVKAEDLPQDHQAWELEAHYLGSAVANYVFTLSPAAVVLGGGVMRQEHLFEPVRRQVAGLVNGYMKMPLTVPPGLGQNSGIAGALALAQRRCAAAGPQASV